jgi:iron(III) transport system ATP-binding protein
MDDYHEEYLTISKTNKLVGMQTTNISVNQLTFYYENKLIFEDLEFRSNNSNCNDGYVLALMGESGAGKSTLLKILLGIEKKIYSGKVITTPQKPKVSFVPQQAVLFEHLSPKDNAEYYKTINYHKDSIDVKIYDELVDILQLRDILDKSKSINELSGGQMQKLSLLRALSISPHILFLDEPLNGLDAEVKKQFLVLLRKIICEKKIFTIYVTHHKLETALIADEVVYLIKKPNQPVSSVAQDNVVDFLKNPLSLDAARVFGYPDLDVLRCKKKGIDLPKAGDTIIPADSNDENDYYLTFDDQEISFNNNGIDFEVISSTPIYTTLKVKDSIINFKNSHLVGKTCNLNTQKLVINGNVKLFDGDYKFLSEMTIKDNKFI